MSLERDTISYQRWIEFHYFQDGKTDGFDTISIAPSKRFKIIQFRIHLSSAFASVEDFVVYVSSVNGSRYNHKLCSYAMNNTQTFIQGYSSDILEFFSDDQIVINFSMVSNTNGWGVEVLGWAVEQKL